MDTSERESLAMDMSQFQGAFFEEAAEHLADLESLLVRIDVNAPTTDDLNAIFRAAHSLKGGSAMFGFQDMTTLTHELESLLDKVRKHELALRAEMIDVLLASSDLLRAQCAHYSGQTDTPVPILEMCKRIRGCITGAVVNSPGSVQSTTSKPPSAAPSAGAPAAAAPVVPPVASTAATSAPRMRTIEITFPAAPEVVDLLPDLIAQLGELGRLEEIAPVAAKKKRGKRAASAAAAVPSRVLRLTTEATDDLVLTLFEFIMDSSTVKIALIAPPLDEAAVTPSSDAAIGADANGAPANGTSGNGDGTPAAAISNIDPGYGFFAPLPEPASPAAATATKVASEPRASGAGAGKADAARPVVASDSSIRVGVEKVDQLINQVGELVITQAMLAQSVAMLDPIANEKLVAGMADLERNTRDLQESVMSIRMMPISFVFNRFPRLVRDLANKLGKQAQLTTQGEGTELDKGLIEKISDPLTHLVRNSIDHGIETPEARVAAGKPPLGTVNLRAAHQGGNIIIEVSDDGAGLDRNRILAKAKQRGMAVSDAMTDQEVWGLLFEAGFSTAEVVTDVSGRGVGMDVVRRNITALAGTVEIDSVLGVGTRMTVRLPLTLAIMDGMSVAVGSEVYILPIASIVESLQIAEGQVRSIANSGLVIEVRGEFLPVVSLHELFVSGPALGGRASGTLVIVEADGGKTALLVDELLGQHQVVVKSLDVNFRRVHGISGATIMGDGRVALILDVATLTRNRRQTSLNKS